MLCVYAQCRLVQACKAHQELQLQLVRRGLQAQQADTHLLVWDLCKHSAVAVEVAWLERQVAAGKPLAVLGVHADLQAVAGMQAYSAAAVACGDPVRDQLYQLGAAAAAKAAGTDSVGAVAVVLHVVAGVPEQQHCLHLRPCQMD